MIEITTPNNLDSLTELGRTLTDDTLYVHYVGGLVGVHDRRTTRWAWYQNDTASTSDIEKQYQQRGIFIA